MAEAGSADRVAETAWIRHFSGPARPGPSDSRCPRCRSRSSPATGASRMSRSAAAPTTAFGSPRSRSRSRRRRPSSCSTSTRRRGVWPDDVRVRHLLSHTSGFDGRARRRRARRHGAVRRGDDALARAVAELPGVRRLVPGGELFSYANTGYWLLGHLVAQAAETTLRGRCRRAGPAQRRHVDRRLRRALAGRDRAACGRRSLPAGPQTVGRPGLARRRSARPSDAGSSRARGLQSCGCRTRLWRAARSTASASRASGSAASRSGATAARTAASSPSCCSCPTAAPSSRA